MARKPDFRLKVSTKTKPRKSAFVGAAWVNTDAEGKRWLTITLNPGVRLAWDDELRIGLFQTEGAGEDGPAPGEKEPPF